MSIPLLKKPKTFKLTEPQLRALKDLSDDKYEFPGDKQWKTYETLEHYGLAQGELKLFRAVIKRGGLSQFKRAYKRSKAGKAFLEGLANEQ